MEGNNNQTKKDLTLNDLAQMITEGFAHVDQEFKKTNKSIDKKIEHLATSTQKEFLNLNSNIETIKTNINDIKADLNKKIDRFEHNELKYRVEKTEEKLGLKPKLKFA